MDPGLSYAIDPWILPAAIRLNSVTARFVSLALKLASRTALRTANLCGGNAPHCVAVLQTCCGPQSDLSLSSHPDYLQ